jgi:aminopeptidase N
MLDQRDKIENQVPMVRGKVITEEEVYEADKGGPGQDIYYKGAWMLHTLRNLIGDKDFYAATRLEVYGRTDPKPGNFKPRFGSTDEFIANVNKVTGKDYTWFFNVYLRQAALPKLVEQRNGDTLTLTWQAPAGLPFPMPVEVELGDKITKLAMTNGTGSVTVPKGAHVVVDPYDRVLKDEPAITAYQQWVKAQRAAAKSTD